MIRTPADLTMLSFYLAVLSRLGAWRLWFTLALMVCVSLTEGVGLLLLVPLLQAVGLDVQQGALGRMEAWIAAAFETAGIQPSLVLILGLYVLIIGAQTALQRIQRLANLKLVQGVLLHLHIQLYRAITRSNWLFYSRRRAADFTHLLTSELDRVGSATAALLSLMAQVLVGAIYLALAFHVAPEMTMLALLCGSILLFLLRGSTRIAHATGEGYSLAMGNLYNAVIEHMGGMKTTKSYRAEERNTVLFSQLCERLYRVNFEAVRSFESVGAWFRIGSVTMLSILLYVSITVLNLSAAAILLLLFLFARLVPRFSSMQQSYNTLVNSLPAVRKIFDAIQQCETAAEVNTQQTGDLSFEHGIRFDEVSFSYREESATPTLATLDLFIPARQTTALVGPSGSGKSTVADLVMGLLVPTRGQVLIDGVPLHPNHVQGWRERIGYVAQDACLFHESVRGNLQWAHPAADDAELWEALVLAAADGFVSRLPQGLDTLIGDRGVQLSGGERQRLALARALLRRPSLLILDEATSALDSENEQRIRSAIEELHGQLTILVITHRLATVREADVIHVVEDGRIVDTGTWEGLLTHGGRFAELCRTQTLVTAPVAGSM